MSEVLQNRINEIRDKIEESIGTEDFPYYMGYFEGICYRTKLNSNNIAGDPRPYYMKHYDLGYEDGYGDRKELISLP